MSRSLYLIAPKSTVPNHYGADFIEYWGFSSVQWMADVTLTTLAALAPPDFTVRLCDEAISPIDFDTSADFIGLTGKITQRERMIEVGAEFRRRGKTVLIGGPSASLSPDPFRHACDVLVRGEIEEIAPELFSDLRSGRWREEYDGGRPDLASSPIPQWSLYPNHRAVVGALQTSRGCPFDCEFCDVIPYLGRKQRHKPIGNVLAELDVLYGHGYREVFLTDDNFTVYRRRAKEVVDALRGWNERPDREPVFFTTQASIDAARDEELLGMCAGAGLNQVFIGIETPNEAALREANKRQNLLDGPIGQIEKFLGHGIMVRSGMMVGFDADGPDVFERQFEFAMATPIPNFSVGAVVAPEATPLHARMRKSGRLIEGANETAAVPWETNIAPIGMTREQLCDRHEVAREPAVLPGVLRRAAAAPHPRDRAPGDRAPPARVERGDARPRAPVLDADEAVPEVGRGVEGDGPPGRAGALRQARGRPLRRRRHVRVRAGPLPVRPHRLLGAPSRRAGRARVLTGAPRGAARPAPRPPPSIPTGRSKRDPGPPHAGMALGRG